MENLDLPPDLSDAELAQYSQLRAESLAAKGFQQSILQWCLGAVAAFAVAGAAFVTADKAIISANFYNFYAAFITVGWVVPPLVALAFGNWLGEVNRMERVGRFLRERESARAVEYKLSLDPYARSSRLDLSWESTIFDRSMHKQYGKNSVGSVSSVFLFSALFYGQLGAAKLITFAATESGFKDELLLALADGSLLVLALSFPLIFGPLLLLVNRRSHGKLPMPVRLTLPTRKSVDLVLPCLNEYEAIPHVLTRVPDGVKTFVVDNGSSDGSRARASYFGRVIDAPVRGIGIASKLGIEAGTSSIVCIMDLDATVDPAEIGKLIGPILRGEADYVVGRRVFEKGSHGPAHRVAVFARRLCLRLFVPGWTLHDIGSSRAVRRSILTPDLLDNLDSHVGWSIDLTLSILLSEKKYRVTEVPVRHSPRVGRSKVTGTLRGFLRTAWVSSCMIWRHSRTARNLLKATKATP